MAHETIDRARRDTIADAFARSVGRNGPREAIRYGDRTWTFAALDAAANRVANALLAQGLVPGDRVAAYGRNSDAYVILWLACTKAGLIHVPVNYALTGGELIYIVSQSGAKALFHDPSVGANVAAVAGDISIALGGTLKDGDGLDILALATSAAPATRPEVTMSGSDVAQLLYTSGTTAAPKGAMMTHQALNAHYTSALLSLDFRPGDRTLAALPLYHSAQMHVFLMPFLLMGGLTIILEAPVPELCFQLIQDEKISALFFPPTVWISMLRHPGFDSHDLSSLERGYYGASIMPVPVLEELSRRLPQVGLYNAYGQSEIGPLATVLRPEEHAGRPASAGRPIFNVETRVVDPEMNDCPPGEMGEIVHRSPQLLVGYWDKPEETEAAFAGGWFHSGDVGYLDEGGYLFIADRVKDIINTGGVVVSSREVEEALYTHPAVSEVAVIALPDPKWIEAVAAVVSIKSGHSIEGVDLIAHARARLAPFKVPKRVFFVDTLPRNTAGKLLKRELRKIYEAEVEGA
ncbi:acyl-CoA synthetase [Segnochrobactraceae bacterium EtOH-i3]